MKNYSSSGNREKNKSRVISVIEIFAAGAKVAFGIGILVLVLILCVYGFNQLSYKFTLLKNVYIRGNHILKASYIASIGVGKFSKPLGDYRLKKIYTNVVSIPWIEKASVAKVYPDTLVINVKEKQIGALIVTGKEKMLVSCNGEIIGGYTPLLHLPSGLPVIVVKDKEILRNNKRLIKDIISFYEKLDKIAKINYIDVVSESYQIAHLANGLNVGVNSFDCPQISLIRFKEKLPYLLSVRNKLESVSICFNDKFVLKWKKGVMR